jgi:carbon monoxide dehydrogenase subunit G
MASIRKEISLRASPEAVWDVVRDVAAVATRFAPGFVVDVQMEQGARLVTFGNGMVVRETIVDLDETARRLAYSVASEQLTHHNASFQVLADGPGSRLVWMADLLPDTAAATIDAMMEQGAAAAKRTLDGLAPRPTGWRGS